VRARRGEGVELQARVVHLVHVPEHVEAMQANVNEKGDQVKQDEAERDLRHDR
jgi:hypothetical protein